MKSQNLLISLGILIGVLGTFQSIQTWAGNLLSDADNEAKPALELMQSELTDEAETDSESTVDEATEQETINYSQLEEYLDQEKWEEADQETYKLLLLAIGPKSAEQGRFVLDEWQKAEYCPAFIKINDLWKNASEKKLGFTSQKEVFEEEQDFNKFYVAIKWKEGLVTTKWLVAWEYNDESKQAEYLPDKTPKFDLGIEEFPKGYLPAKLEWEPENGEIYDYRFEAIAKCEL